MGRPRALVLRTAGTNCDAEAVHACELAGAEVERLHIHRLLADPTLLERYHLLILPGGFSYGDDIGGGRILANEIRHRLAEPFERFTIEGKLVLGICNGFQVLVKSGLLPGGVPGPTPTVTLTHNDSNRFEDRWVYLKAVSDRCVFVERGEILYLPVAHAEGKFMTIDDDVTEQLRTNDQIAFVYTDAQGRTIGYPGNPNGSIHDIAGITSPNGRMLGLMPHPERHVSPYQHPSWTRRPPGPNDEGAGLAIFRRAMELAKAELV